MKSTPMLAAVIAATGLLACGRGEPTHADDAHSGAHDGHEEVATGPHGGRLLEADGFAVEIVLDERSEPAELRAYAHRGDERLAPEDVRLDVTLRRLGGREERIAFRPVDDHLRGGPIDEPHSYGVTVVAEHGGITRRWEYASYENRTVLSPAAIADAGIVIDTVRPATIRTVLRVPGRIRPNEERLAHVIPRYAGVVRSVAKRLGEQVARGEVLAVVEGNQTLQAYEVRSPIDGTVIERDAVVGELVGEGRVIYAIADLTTVWLDLDVPPGDFERLRVGQPVSPNGGTAGEGTLAYLAPIAAASTQTLLARAVIPNPEGRWRPGLFVSADVLVDEASVPRAVRTSALQRVDDRDVVFLTDGAVFQATPVTLGRRDAEWVEIVGGVEAGQLYAADNSFVLKADVGKAGASHDQ